LEPVPIFVPRNWLNPTEYVSLETNQVSRQEFKTGYTN